MTEKDDRVIADALRASINLIQAIDYSLLSHSKFSLSYLAK
jgi:hypothetical protein